MLSLILAVQKMINVNLLGKNNQDKWKFNALYPGAEARTHGALCCLAGTISLLLVCLPTTAMFLYFKKAQLQSI